MDISFKDLQIESFIQKNEHIFNWITTGFKVSLTLEETTVWSFLTFCQCFYYLLLFSCVSQKQSLAFSVFIHLLSGNKSIKIPFWTFEQKWRKCFVPFYEKFPLHVSSGAKCSLMHTEFHFWHISDLTDKWKIAILFSSIYSNNRIILCLCSLVIKMCFEKLSHCRKVNWQEVLFPISHEAQVQLTKVLFVWYWHRSS